MAFQTDLKAFCLDDLKEIIAEYYLIPSRIVLKERLEEILSAVKKEGIENLYDLKKTLNNKKLFQNFIRNTGLDEEFLKILLREIKSYEVKKISIDKLEFLTETEIKVFQQIGIKTNQQLWDYLKIKEQDIPGISFERQIEIFLLTDILRINGVGIVFAEMLIEIGLTSPGKIYDFSEEELLKFWSEYQSKNQLQTALGKNDISWLKKYCYLLRKR